MIPDHLIDKAVRAQIIFEGKDPDDPCEQWRFGAYGLEVGVAIEAVAADIWAQGFDAGCEDVLNHQDDPETECIQNPYEETA